MQWKCLCIFTSHECIPKQFVISFYMCLVLHKWHYGLHILLLCALKNVTFVRFICVVTQSTGSFICTLIHVTLTYSSSQCHLVAQWMITLKWMVSCWGHLSCLQDDDVICLLFCFASKTCWHVNQNHKEILLHTHLDGFGTKDGQCQILERVWRNWSPRHCCWGCKMV